MTLISFSLFVFFHLFPLVTHELLSMNRPSIELVFFFYMSDSQVNHACPNLPVCYRYLPGYLGTYLPANKMFVVVVVSRTGPCRDSCVNPYFYHPRRGSEGQRRADASFCVAYCCPGILLPCHTDKHFSSDVLFFLFFSWKNKTLPLM